ncbi:uncharacterized protein LOC135934681 [Cloeon dipterum]|uniref:uncharacterized protein LOC135934681 n=1 Tax=Cloeon dipterum TaxID=197152 RepID=UPI00321FECE1
MRYVSQLVQIPRRATKAQSREQKYNRALAICKQIADSASHLGTKQFDDSLLNLQQIKQLIDTEGAFFVAGKNSGRNANVLRPVEDVGVFDVEEVCSVSCEDDGNNVEAQANYSVQAEESQGREIGSAEDGLALVEVSEVESAGQEAGKDFEEDKDGSVEIAVAHEEESAIEEFGSRGQDAGKDLENEKDSSGEVEVYEKSDDVKEAKAGPPLISSTPKKVIEIDLTIDESDEMINATTSVTKSEKAEVDAVEQDDALDDEALRQISQIEDIALSQRERQEQSKLSDEISEYGLQQISQAEISALSTGINSGLDSKQSEGENNAGRNEASKSRDIATEPGFDTIRITSGTKIMINKL